MERLANAQAEASKRAQIAETALSGLRDVQMEDRDRLSKLAASQGVVHNHIDQSVVNNTQNVHQDANVHNQVMHLVNTHGAQFGSYMEQQRLNHEQMMDLLYNHVRMTQPAPVIYMMPPQADPMEIGQFSGGGPPSSSTRGWVYNDQEDYGEEEATAAPRGEEWRPTARTATAASRT